MPQAGKGKAGGKFRVLVSDEVADAGLKILQARPEFSVDVKVKLPPDKLKKELAGADALVIRSATKVTSDILSAASALKIIGRAGVGVDNVDVPEATRRGILVVNAPEGNTIAAAEHAFALMLAMSRNIPDATASLRAGEWKRSKFIGNELLEKTLGLVGLGRIGREMASRARAFGMKVLATDPVVSPDRAAELGVDLVDLKTLLRKSDFVSLHAALTTETKGMMGSAQFAIAKPGLRIINCARGKLIDEKSLVEAIKKGRLAGAALDVFESEPPAPDNPLLRLENVIVTPHLGASTEEAQVNVAVVVAEQIRDYLLGGMVRNAVNAPASAPEVLGEIGPYIGLVEKMGKFLIQVADGALKRIELNYMGEIGGRDLTPISAAAVKGVLEGALGGEVNDINAMILAKDRGIEIGEKRSSGSREFASLIRMSLVTAKQTRTAEGAVVGKAVPRLLTVDGYHLDIVPEGTMITYLNSDTPGVVGKVGTILGAGNVNIAELHLARVAAGKKAMSVLNVDSQVPAKVVKELSELKELSDVKVVSL